MEPCNQFPAFTITRKWTSLWELAAAGSKSVHFHLATGSVGHLVTASPDAVDTLEPDAARSRLMVLR